MSILEEIGLDGASTGEIKKATMDSDDGTAGHSTTELLDTRELTHGDYIDTARIAQRLKGIIQNEVEHRKNRGQAALDFTKRESLDLMCTKISRILSGEPTEEDHWDDIAGYAKLGKR